MSTDAPSVYTDAIALLVRVLGLVVLLVGLVIGIKIIMEAWELYDNPERIERFANEIERGSNLDQILNQFADKQTTKQAPVQVLEGAEHREQAAPQSSQASAPLRLSYFLAWGLAILLLMVIGGLASSAIRTGGQLALYDLQVKRFARQMIQEARRTESD
jgi:hypothetical protein